jgi:hypothetical protein
VAEDITKLMEELTGIPPVVIPRRLTGKKRQEQAARVKRFLALPPELQEGILKYGEKIREAYSKKT